MPPSAWTPSAACAGPPGRARSAWRSARRPEQPRRPPARGPAAAIRRPSTPRPPSARKPAERWERPSSPSQAATRRRPGSTGPASCAPPPAPTGPMPAHATRGRLQRTHRQPAARCPAETAGFPHPGCRPLLPRAPSPSAPWPCSSPSENRGRGARTPAAQRSCPRRDTDTPACTSGQTTQPGSGPSPWPRSPGASPRAE